MERLIELANAFGVRYETNQSFVSSWAAFVFAYHDDATAFANLAWPEVSYLRDSTVKVEGFGAGWRVVVYGWHC
jgi:inosine-uridine nucleoside N-ribohydrolase